MIGKLSQVREALAACFIAHDEPLTKGQVFAWIGTNYPDADFDPNTLQAQLYRSCDNTKSAKNSSAPKIILYDKPTRTYLRLPIGYIPQITPPVKDPTLEDEDEVVADSKFALEAHLRDYLARNLSSIEKGLILWSAYPASVEYPIEGRRIDILAKDREGIPVVIELKLSKGHERTLGQALYYRGRLKQLLKVGRVRIIMIAAEITDELRIASMEIADVDVFSYRLTMQVARIDLT